MHPGPGYRGAVNHGLFGSLVVEPPDELDAVGQPVAANPAGQRAPLRPVADDDHPQTHPLGQPRTHLPDCCPLPQAPRSSAGGIQSP